MRQRTTGEAVEERGGAIAAFGCLGASVLAALIVLLSSKLL